MKFGILFQNLSVNKNVRQFRNLVSHSLTVILELAFHMPSLQPNTP
jgi:hypothetical protein